MRALLLNLLFFLLAAPFAFVQSSEDIHPCGNDDYYSPWLRHYLANPVAGPRNDEILYLPLQIHSVGDDDGSGHTDLRQLLAAFCTLNGDFAASNIQFYLANPVNYINNSDYYEHNYSQGFEMMQTNNLPGVINCYVVERAAGACGYYAFGPDAIALNKNCNSPQDHTWAHEVGHYLSLPHTFYGWEGEEHDYDNPAPNDWGGWEVERLSGDNCANAGDGFCDTPPDYLNYRWGCTETGESGVVQLDPDSLSFRSDGTLFMSYSRDDCMNRFSDEQTAAMRAMVATERQDLVSTTPPVEDWQIAAEDVQLNPVFPTPGQPVDVTNELTISWEPIPGATHYIVQVNPLPSFVVVFDSYVVDEPALTLTDLNNNRNYYYRVQPYNPLNTCLGFSNIASFSTGAVTSAGEAPSQDTDLRIFPNPVHDGLVRITLDQEQAAPASLTLFDALGRPALQRSYPAAGGQQNIELDVSQLPAGVYTLRWQAGQQFSSRKLIIQH